MYDYNEYISTMKETRRNMENSMVYYETHGDMDKAMKVLHEMCVYGLLTYDEIHKINYYITGMLCRYERKNHPNSAAFIAIRGDESECPKVSNFWFGAFLPVMLECGSVSTKEHRVCIPKQNETYAESNNWEVVLYCRSYIADILSSASEHLAKLKRSGRYNIEYGAKEINEMLTNGFVRIFSLQTYSEVYSPLPHDLASVMLWPSDGKFKITIAIDYDNIEKWYFKDTDIRNVIGNRMRGLIDRMGKRAGFEVEKEVIYA